MKRFWIGIGCLLILVSCSKSNGSDAENLTLFDFNNNALPALTSLGTYQ